MLEEGSLCSLRKTAGRCVGIERSLLRKRPVASRPGLRPQTGSGQGWPGMASPGPPPKPLGLSPPGVGGIFSFSCRFSPRCQSLALPGLVLQSATCMRAPVGPYLELLNPQTRHHQESRLTPLLESFRACNIASPRVLADVTCSSWSMWECRPSENPNL